MLDPNLFNFNFSYNYIFSTVPISQINSGIYIALVRFMKSLLETFISLLSVFFYVSIFLAKLLTLVFPHAVKLAKLIYEFHRTQLTKTDLLIEVVVLTFLLAGLLFRKRIFKLWSDVELYISKKSKAAAKAAPHVLFFGVSFILSIVGKKFIMPLTSAAVMPIFTLIIPLVSTSIVIYKSQNNIAHRNLSDMYSHKILLWVILAIYHAIVTILSFVPFSNRLLSVLPYLKELVIVVLVWVQISSAFATIVYKSVVTPILKKISTYIPATSFEEKVQQSGMVVRMLKTMRILSDAQEMFIGSLLQDSVASLMALVFIFMPNPFASVGMVVVALLLPAFRTAATTSALMHAKITARTLASQTSSLPTAKLPTMMAVHRQWLDYWVCVGVLWCIRIYGINFWPSILILTTLYLQHSYFQGASTVIRHSYESMCLLVDRNKEMRRQRLMEANREREEREEREFEEQTLDPHSSMSEVYAEETATVEQLTQVVADVTADVTAAKSVVAVDAKVSKESLSSAPKSSVADKNKPTSDLQEGPFSSPAPPRRSARVKSDSGKDEKREEKKSSDDEDYIRVGRDDERDSEAKKDL